MALTRITSDGITDAAIVNADINASAAIAGSKIADFVSNNANNRVLTATGTANSFNGETNLTFSGSSLIQSGNHVLKNQITDSSGLKISQEASDVSQIFNHYAGAMTFGVNNTEKMRIDSSGRLLIGHTSSQFSMKLSVAGTDGGGSSCSLSRFSNNTSPSTLLLSKSRGTSVGSYTVVQDDDQVGSIDFRGADGTDNNSKVAEIIASIDGTPGSNDMPGRLQFHTTADGASSTTERMRIDSSGHVGIGMTPSGVRLDVTSTVNDIARFSGPNSGGITIRNDTSNEVQIHSGNSDALIFGTNGENERMRIDSSGRLLLGTTTEGHEEGDDLTIATSGVTGMTIRSGTSSAGNIFFSDATSGSAERQGIIRYDHSDDAMKFNVNNAERMRILSNGSITTNGNTSVPTGSTQGFGFTSDQFYLSYTGTSANYSQRFYNGNGLVGSILVNGSSTTYNTSSDYRLKQNVVTLSDGILRLKQLKPYKFNFIADKSTTFDGFFAHEAQAVVPESATGVKDEVESEDNTETNTKKGDPKYQGIDQSRLVPLLVAALQEAIVRIEALEAG